MNTIQNIEFAPFPGGCYVRFQPVGADHVLFIRQQPGEAKAAGITRYQADTAGQWSSTALTNDGTKLTFGGAQWPHLDTMAAKQGTPWNAVNGPAAIIQANGLPPGPYDALLVALDAVCPSAYQTLYADDKAVYSSRLYGLGPDCDTQHGACLPGSNMGCWWWTDQAGLDFMLVNGQGDSKANPVVVAATTFSFAVPDTPVLATGGSQVFVDTFATEPIFGSRQNVNIQTGAFDQVMTTAAGTWDIRGRQVDLNNTEVFWHAGHVMGVCFEAGTEGSSEPAHSQYGALSWLPRAKWDFSAGILHVRCFVDCQGTNRRYPSIAVYPANDPLTGFAFQEGVQVNASNEALFIEMESGTDVTNELNGVKVNVAVTGAAGQAEHQAYFPLMNYQLAWPSDCRMPVDLFIDNAGRVALYLAGVKVSDVTLAAPLPFMADAAVAITTWSYHTPIDTNVLPFESLYPHSYENHIGPIAGEVLPLSAWSALPKWIPLWSAGVPSPWQAPGGATLLDVVQAVNVPPVQLTPTQQSTLSSLNAQVPASGNVTTDLVKQMIAFWQSLLAAN